MKRRIHILATGGTIAGVGEQGRTDRYASGVLTVDALLERLPALEDLAAVSYEQVANLNSDDITQSLWLSMAQHIDRLAAAEPIDGFVITHGTDTLEESAYFFHLALRCGQPVVLTGAMRPATATSPDGPLNLYQAIALAASDAAKGHGVLVLFNEGIYSARDVRKGNTFRTHAITGGDLGTLGLMRETQPTFYHASLKAHTSQTLFDLSKVQTLPTVAVAYFHVDADPEILDSLAERHDGLVVAGAGDGIVSLRWEARLRELCRRGIPVVRATRVPDGAVLRNAGMPDDDIGTIAADTHSPEKARVLLMLALTVTRDPRKIQNFFWQY